MNTGEVQQQFARAAAGAQTITALGHRFERASRKLGFEYFAMLHHISIYRGDGRTVFLHNYPDAWAATMHVRQYVPDDPVIEVCKRQTAPFLWSDMGSLVEMTPRQREIMREAKRAGLVNGFTVPIHHSGDATGSCSFATGGAMPIQSVPAATALALIAFDAARRLVRREPSSATGGRLKLTRQERDCLLLLGRGSSDAETSRVLGVSQATVTACIDEARRKYGAATRMELIVRSLYRAEVRFADLIDVEDELSGTPLTRRRDDGAFAPVPMARLGALFFGTNPSRN